MQKKQNKLINKDSTEINQVDFYSIPSKIILTLC